MNPIKFLPSTAQQLIYEFAGPEPAAEEAHNEFLDLIDTGRIGIPAWETWIENGSFPENKWIERRFVIPSYDYYEIRKIRNINWWFPNDLSSYYFSKYNQKSPYRFAFSYKFPEFQKYLRDNTAIVPGKEYCIFNEGGFETPIVPLTFQQMNDYDLLYSLKVLRGKTLEEVKTAIERWYKVRKEYETDFRRDQFCYIDRIYIKLKKRLAYL